MRFSGCCQRRAGEPKEAATSDAAITVPQPVRCAVYTCKSTEEGLDKDFNSLHTQREAVEAFILSQRQEGWRALPYKYDDGGFTGANMDRPGKPKKAPRKATPKSVANATPRTHRKPTAQRGSKASERSNKKSDVIAMMKRAKGATLAEIILATGWQKHTVAAS